jgi:hypothetical protein
VKTGPWLAWYPSGKPKATGEYHEGKRHGRWLVWNPSGELISDRVYKFGVLLQEASRAGEANESESRSTATSTRSASAAPVLAEKARTPAPEDGPQKITPRAPIQRTSPADVALDPDLEPRGSVPEEPPPAPKRAEVSTQVSKPPTKPDQNFFVFSGLGPGASKGVIGLGARGAYVLVPMLDFNYVHGVTDALDLELRASTIAVITLAQLGLRFRLLGDEHFSFAARTDLVGFANIATTNGFNAGVMPGLLISLGNHDTQWTLGCDVAVVFTGVLPGVPDSFNNSVQAAISPNTAVEFRITSSMHIYLAANLYLIPSTKLSVPPFALAIGASW